MRPISEARAPKRRRLRPPRKTRPYRRPPTSCPAGAAPVEQPFAPPPVTEEVAKQQAQKIAEDIEKAAPPPPSDAKATAAYKPDKPPEKVMEGLLKQPPENIKSREEAVAMIKDILKRTGAPAAISEIVENPDTEHATSVAIYSTLFAMGLKRNEGQLLQDVIVASLMHDIGLTQINPAVIPIPAKQLAGAQHAAFQGHVSLGLSMLGELDYSPNKRVVGILSQHHEKFNGSGYPQHLESFRIDELAQIIGIADLIDSISRGRYDGTIRTLSDSLVTIAQIEKTSTFPEFFNPDTFKRVMNWLKKGGGIDFLAAAEEAVTETKKKLLKTG